MTQATSGIRPKRIWKTKNSERMAHDSGERYGKKRDGAPERVERMIGESITLVPPGPSFGYTVDAMPRYRTVLFDLDGTLIDSIQLIVDSYHHTFTTFSLPLRSD